MSGYRYGAPMPERVRRLDETPPAIEGATSEARPGPIREVAVDGAPSCCSVRELSTDGLRQRRESK